MAEIKVPLDNWIEVMVAFHKSKRKFVSLKELQLEDANQLLICEFRGYDFKIRLSEKSRNLSYFLTDKTLKMI
jgi:hypothetical protein